MAGGPTAPLAARMRPTTLDEIVGQRHLLGEGAPLRALIETDRLSSIILWGPPGTGKTTLARVVASRTEREFVALSAVTAGVKDVREVTAAAARLLDSEGRGTILFLDEVHRFNKTQQDALLPAVEAGTLTLIGATTENPFFEVNAPLISRSTIFRLTLLSDDDLGVVVDRALDVESVTLAPSATRASSGTSSRSSGTRNGDGSARSELVLCRICGSMTGRSDTEAVIRPQPCRFSRPVRLA